MSTARVTTMAAAALDLSTLAPRLATVIPVRRTKVATPKETAAAIRVALKAAFPATAFSVRTSRSSGCYDYLTCSWTDGPMLDAAHAITRPFESGRGDRRLPDHPWTCRWVELRRSYSTHARNHAEALTQHPGRHLADVECDARRILDKLDLTGVTA